MTDKDLLSMLETCEHNDDTPGYFIDLRNPNNIIPSYEHAYIILKRELVNHSYIISESDTPSKDIIQAINDVVDRYQITDNMILIIREYLESVEINMENRSTLEKILVKTKSIKLRELIQSFLL